LSQTFKFESKITKFETLNPLFTKVLIKIAYVGLNRNSSYISREAIEKAIPSIFHCPIVGEYSESLEDFRGHGGKIEVTDDNIKWVNTTIPYGVIDSDTEISWEDVVEDDGTIKTYFCATGYLWSGRFPELEQLLENSKSQSMEIEIVSGDYIELDGAKVYEIKDFIFSGFCILGDDVEPCFESSEIVRYSFDKSKFKVEFKQMVAELKFSLQQSFDLNKEIKVLNKGGFAMEELQQLLDKYSLSLDDLSTKNISHEDISLDELEVKIKEAFNKEPKFTLTSEQLEDELKRELAEIETITDEYWDDYTYPRYSFIDYMPEQMVVVSYDCKESILVGFNYSLTNENVEVDSESVVRYKVEFVPMNLTGDTDEVDDVFSKNFTSISQVDRKVKLKESELNKQFESEKATTQETLEKVQGEFSKLKEDYSSLEQIANELEAYQMNIAFDQRKDAEDKLFESFSSELTEDEMSPIKVKKSNFSLEEIEEKLFALAGRKKTKLTFSKTPEQKSIRLKIPNETSTGSDKDYADLIERHRNK